MTIEGATMNIPEEAKRLIRDLPESFWDVGAWQGENLLSMDASVDGADRVRIVATILEKVKS
jgi:hypothetical protein